VTTWLWILAAALAVYAIFVVALVLAGRKEHARAVAGFVPDCAILFARLAKDRRIPRRRRALLAAAAAYLAMPLDLVPDFIPVAGQLDDALLVVLTLRALARSGGRELVSEHWPGPPQSLGLVLRATRLI
jgi:uncharacterized membrane protein YkvA (DUF1232 family)